MISYLQSLKAPAAAQPQSVNKVMNEMQLSVPLRVLAVTRVSSVLPSSRSARNTLMFVTVHRARVNLRCFREVLKAANEIYRVINVSFS